MDGVVRALLVGGGGFIGANCRYWAGVWLEGKAGSGFPWTTLLINVLGSLAIGLFLGAFGALNWQPNWRLFVAVGILGGFTTFSAFSWETVQLLQSREFVKAAAYVGASVVLSVAAAWVGLQATTNLVSRH